jgi:hypothetical protein
MKKNDIRVVCKILDLQPGYAILENKERIWWLGGEIFKWPRSDDMHVNDNVIIELKEIDNAKSN